MSATVHGHDNGGKKHLLGMLAIAGVVLVALVAVGRSLGEALPLAAVLACPLMMIGMMFMMMRAGNTSVQSDHHQSDERTESATPGTSQPPTASTLL
jgi:amino acid permease